LSAPYYGATIGIAFSRFWKKYATFSGRASRSEYWWWYLISIIVSAIFGALAAAFGGYGMQADGTMAPPSAGAVVIYILWGIWGLATIIPHLALLVRRLHDANLRGWWIFISLVPLVGSIILLVFTILPSKPEGARFDDGTRV
jgi:uncharacterized membrane protein YhaH (DUF805 family)